MKKKLYQILENGKVNYVTKEKSDNKIVAQYDDEGYNNMVNMVSIFEDYTHAQQGNKVGKTKLFSNHHSFFGNISLYDLCMKYGYHREVIHNVLKNWVMYANTNTIAIGGML